MHPHFSKPEKVRGKTVNSPSYRTTFANKETVKQKWYLVDAEDQVLGRLASRIANIIRGKHKPNFTPHVNCGDKVVVINAEKIILTGKKMDHKPYIRYTGYPGGERTLYPRDIMKKHPTEIIRMAVNRMLPKNRLQSKFMNNLYLFEGTEHKHQAQNPEKLEL